MSNYTEEEIGSAIAELILLQHYLWEHPNEDAQEVIKKRINQLSNN
tara:strand:- start:1518 stop:1655 length:138 start_codon:yes stop_codon:yes gene_type:complete